MKLFKPFYFEINPLAIWTDSFAEMSILVLHIATNGHRGSLLYFSCGKSVGILHKFEIELLYNLFQIEFYTKNWKIVKVKYRGKVKTYYQDGKNL